jgi:hypothetical protein
MSELINLEDNILPITLNYFGDITYKTETYNTPVGMNFVLGDVYYNPIAYNLSRDVMSVVTSSQNYDDVFNNIRNEKTSTDIIADTLSAMALNDSINSEVLSGTLVEEGIDAIIAFVDAGDGSYIETANYSFNTSISFSNAFFKYDSGNLVAETDVNVTDEDIYFYISLLDESLCNIVKGGLSSDEYMTFVPATSSFVFQENEDVNLSRFFYSYNSEESTILFIVQDYGVIEISETDVGITALSSGVIQTNIFNVNPKNSLENEEPIVNSFVPIYGNKNNVANVFFVDNAALVTHNYASSIDKNSNYITLKNNVTYDGEYSTINIDSNLYMRQYTGVNTGTRGNTGYSNYVMNYTSGYYKYNFAPDKLNYFNVPFDLRGYSQININDCKLVDNGSLGGNSPLNSDKLFKKLYEYSDFRNTGCSIIHFALLNLRG